MIRYICDRCDATIAGRDCGQIVDIEIEWPDPDRVGGVRMQTVIVKFSVGRLKFAEDTPDLCGDCYAHILHEVASRLDTDSTPDHLGAAASDLLAALKAIADDYDALCGDGMTESTQPPQLRDARAAIAKAEGR